MGKKLAIKGHSTRGKEVIELLKMLGGSNIHNLTGCNDYAYYINDEHQNIIRSSDYIFGHEYMQCFTLEEFLDKYPFKVGDVIKFPNNMAEEIAEMKWDEELEDAIYTSVSGYTRPSFVPKNTNNKTNMKADCKKCGLHFGSVRCFDKDCPHNKPKSYAVGLKDGKVIECGVNKEIVMNENKPLFKPGDVVKLKGCPDKNLFWIVMDVIKDGYIFNDGKKYSFNDQHHYEKSNREVINPMKNVLAELLEHIKTTPKEELEREFNELEEWSNVGPTVEEFMTFCECVNKKTKYPKTYEECCQHLGCDNKIKMELIGQFIRLINARNAYWKIAGEEMGLDKPWDLVYGCGEWGYWIEYDINANKIYCQDSRILFNRLLVFPSEEMRDAFYENFKDMIKKCKELL